MVSNMSKVLNRSLFYRWGKAVGRCFKSSHFFGRIGNDFNRSKSKAFFVKEKESKVVDNSFLLKNDLKVKKGADKPSMMGRLINKDFLVWDIDQAFRNYKDMKVFTNFRWLGTSLIIKGIVTWKDCEEDDKYN